MASPISGVGRFEWLAIDDPEGSRAIGQSLRTEKERTFEQRAREVVEMRHEKDPEPARFLVKKTWTSHSLVR